MIISLIERGFEQRKAHEPAAKAAARLHPISEGKKVGRGVASKMSAPRGLKIAP
jgi:hypothetical protein